MRSPVYSIPQAAVGLARWVAPGVLNPLVLSLDYIQLAFGVGVGIILSEDFSAITSSVLVTFDDFSVDSQTYMTWSQTTTTITVTDATLAGATGRGGVVVGDVVQLIGTGNVDGFYVVVTTPSTTTYTVTSAVSQTASGSAKHQYWRLFAGPTALTAATTRISAPLSHSTTGPVTGLAFNVTARTTGSATLVVVQGAGP